MTVSVVVHVVFEVLTYMVERDAESSLGAECVIKAQALHATADVARVRGCSAPRVSD